MKIPPRFKDRLVVFFQDGSSVVVRNLQTGRFAFLGRHRGAFASGYMELVSMLKELEISHGRITRTWEPTEFSARNT